jgi:predicted RNase H-related nuclease YkuK (DUF458 family)
MSRVWIRNDERLSDKELVSFLEKYEGKIYVGSDSQHFKQGAKHVSVIGCRMYPGVTYWYSEEYIDMRYDNPERRITKEIMDTAALASEFHTLLPHREFELHFDINPSEDELSSKFANMAAGIAEGYGWSYSLKPGSFTASGAADWHTKTY